MKIPDKIRHKRITETRQLYQYIYDKIIKYDELLYEVIKMLESEDQNKTKQRLLQIIKNELTILSEPEKEKIKKYSIKKQIEQISKNLIYESLTNTISQVINFVKQYYPNSYDDNKIIKLEDIIYKEDGKTLDKRIEEWFNQEKDTDILQYRILLIHFTQTNHAIPRIIKNKTTKVYIEIIPGRGCERSCCNDEYQQEQIYGEDDVELPPYHAHCQCEVVFYEIDDYEESLL